MRALLISTYDLGRQPFGLAVEEPKVEARVVCDEHRVACKLEEAANGDRRVRRAA